jgi:hypothetical protein
MTPNRRQFIATLGAMPLLLHSPLPTLAAQPMRAPQLRDPVLDQILLDLRNLVSEGEAQPSIRKSVLRAVETLLGVQAAHVAAHYDPHLQRSVRRREARIGRSALHDEVLAFAHKAKQSSVSRELIDEAMTRFATGGLAGTLRDLQRAIRNTRLNAPDAFHVMALGGRQFDYCADLDRQIEMVETMASFICAIALAEPTPFGESGCAAMGVTIAYLRMMRSWYC